MHDTSYLSKAIFSNKEFLDAYEKGLFWRGILDVSILKKVFSWGHLNDALATHRITNDRFRLSLKDSYVAPNKQVFRVSKDSFGRPTDHLLMNELHRQLQSGVTGVFESVHEIFPAIENLTNALATKYYSRSSANAYISFGATSGFGVHNDDHDVLVFQIEGKKRWNFFGSSDKKYKATVSNLRFPSEINVTEELILSEGDILFIPKGTWHDVEAIDEPSLHLTISLVYPSARDYVDWLLLQNKFDMPYQDIRLTRENFDEVTQGCKSFFESVISEESLATFIKTYYSRYPSIRNRPCLPSLNKASLKNTYRRIPFAFMDISNKANNNDNYSITALGKKFTLSPQAYQLLSTMKVGECYSGECLLDVLNKHTDTWPSVAVAIEDLLDEGLLTST